MVWLWLVGRVIFAVFFIYCGVNHFLNFRSMTQYAAYKKIPAPGLGVFVSGLLLIGGGLSILTGYLIQPALIALAVFLIASAVTIHDFWTLEDATARMGDMNQFLKNVALAAACLMLLEVTNWTWGL
ncbi:DoxX family membrane protein [Xylanibacillus composti]|uniref:Membrane protein n=1 Tax=Xylanibacillus composti TaxID=1572762 RepID=A0A8J4H5I7_9BACL|nr:DoxX family membrane protein [Xylanibacillus composti]MDT9724840.1 DoxX family membrane protein [Xylanibacillus composti]GIQ69068.1 membrane protein [Xylanibacillus composti]